MPTKGSFEKQRHVHANIARLLVSQGRQTFSGLPQDWMR